MIIQTRTPPWVVMYQGRCLKREKFATDTTKEGALGGLSVDICIFVNCVRSEVMEHSCAAATKVLKARVIREW